jgi:hypothetical protein
MVERLVAGDVLTHATYTAIDRAPALLAEAHRRLCQWARERGFEVDENSQGQLHVWRAGQHITIETEVIDVGNFMAREHCRRIWDLLIGQAFLDLIDMPTTLPGLCSLVRPGGLLYFPTTFDGDTAFQPESDAEFDRAIEACYHQAIDQRVLDGKPSGAPEGDGFELSVLSLDSWGGRRSRSSISGLERRLPFPRRAVRGKSRSDEGRNIAPPISSWPALCRQSTPSSARNKDVDARIKSAQDDFRSIPASPRPVIVAEIISPDSPARFAKPRIRADY